MKILVLRHGNAQNDAPTDSERLLSDKGRAQLQDQLKRHSEALKQVSHIFVSPYTRTQQTLDVLQSALSPLDAVVAVTTPQLTPSGSVQGVMTLLNTLPDDAVVLLVSHQPLVGMFIDTLCHLETGCYRMGTASLALLETDVVAQGCADLKWIKHPELAIG